MRAGEETAAVRPRRRPGRDWGHPQTAEALGTPRHAERVAGGDVATTCEEHDLVDSHRPQGVADRAQGIRVADRRGPHTEARRHAELDDALELTAGTRDAGERVARPVDPVQPGGHDEMER